MLLALNVTFSEDFQYELTVQRSDTSHFALSKIV